MATTLSIVYGSTTITLVPLAGQYAPKGPASGVSPVREYFRVTVSGATIAAMRDAQEAIDRAFVAARARQASGVGPVVYATYRPNGYDAAWRSEILDGSLTPVNDATTKQFGFFRYEAVLAWTRRWFWEGAEIELPLSFGGVHPAVTGGVLIDNASESDLPVSGESVTLTLAGGVWTGTLADPPIVAGSLTGAYHIGGVDKNLTDAGNGTLVNTAAPTVQVGTINYVAGLVSLPTVTGLASPLVCAYTAAGRKNLLTLSATAVDGSLPAPLRIELQRPYVGGPPVLAHDYFITQSPHASDLYLEGEDADEIAGAAAASVASSASNGYQQVATWTGDTDKLAFRWALSSAQVAACAGRWARILARIAAKSSTLDIWLTPKLQYTSGASLVTVSAAPSIMLGGVTNVVDLGLIGFPLNETGVPMTLSFVLYARRVGGGTLTLDFLQASPLLGFRGLSPFGLAMGVPDGGTLVDDGALDEARALSYITPALESSYVSRGSPLLVTPGQAVDFRVLFNVFAPATGLYFVPIYEQHTARFYYRPRRPTL